MRLYWKDLNGYHYKLRHDLCLTNNVLEQIESSKGRAASLAAAVVIVASGLANPIHILTAFNHLI